MLSLMNGLTDTPTWDYNIFEQEFAERWKAANLSKGLDVTQQMVDWCVEEMRHNAGLFQQSRFVLALDRGIQKSDTLVDSATKRAFVAASTKLEEDPSVQKRVLSKTKNLIDPSLYPLTLGPTKFLSSGEVTLTTCVQLSGKGSSAPTLSAKEGRIRGQRPYFEHKPTCSRYFQCLPCEVRFDKQCKGVPE